MKEWKRSSEQLDNGRKSDDDNRFTIENPNNWVLHEGHLIH